MILKEVLEKTTQFFTQKGFSTPRLDSELLISSVLNLSRVDIYLKFDYPLTEKEVVKCRELVMRRSKGEPVAYILGQKGFYNSDFNVTSDVLIPRPETEHLVDAAKDWVIESSISGKDLKMFDFGCGSGCVGLSLLKEFPESQLLAFDLSEEAIQVTGENSKQLGVSDRFRAICTDVSQLKLEDIPVEMLEVDMIVSNPPYIELESTHVEKNVKAYEPHLALFAGEDGLDCIKSWSKIALAFLRPGGLWAFEMGSEQGQVCREIIEELKGFESIQLIKDFSGHDRVMTAIKKG